MTLYPYLYTVQSSQYWRNAKVQYIMFAADTALLIKDKDKENLNKKANKQINKFNYWSNKINLEET